MSYHFLFRAITTNPALSLVILSYHPSYNQDFSELRNHPTLRTYRLITSFLIPCYHAKSCLITSYLSYYQSYNQDFFRTLKSPHPFEFILGWRHSLSRAITPNPALSLVILSYHHHITKIFFRTLKSPHSLWIYPLMTSFLIPCYHAKSCLITCYP